MLAEELSGVEKRSEGFTAKLKRIGLRDFYAGGRVS